MKQQLDMLNKQLETQAEQQNIIMEQLKQGAAAAAATSTPPRKARAVKQEPPDLTLYPVMAPSEKDSSLGSMLLVPPEQGDMDGAQAVILSDTEDF